MGASEMMNAYHLGQEIRIPLRFWVNQTKLRAEAAAAALTIKVRDATGYAAGDVLILNPGTDTEETVTIAGGGVSGTTFTLTAALTYAHGVNEIVGELSNPTTITVKRQTPDGVDQTAWAIADLTNDATGKYSKTLTLDQSGEWLFDVDTTGSPKASFSWKLVVHPTQF